MQSSMIRSCGVSTWLTPWRATYAFSADRYRSIIGRGGQLRFWRIVAYGCLWELKVMPWKLTFSCRARCP
jgi:hypothetical protein